MIRKLFQEFKNFKRDRYAYEKVLRNQLELGFQNLVLGANSKYPPRLKGFSQGEEDFILYALSRILNLRVFLEFGVEDWRESNTRIISSLLNGRFYLIDGSDENINSIKSSREYYSANVWAKKAWITLDNINDLLEKATEELISDFHVISIDIDGNDYWVLNEISAEPEVFVVEYNSLFGPDEKITTMYDPNFDRFSFDESGCIYGGSFSAISSLLAERGYEVFHVSEMGNNIIFIKREHCNLVHSIFSGSKEFRPISFREMHHKGIRTFAAYDAAKSYVLSDRSKFQTIE